MPSRVLVPGLLLSFAQGGAGPNGLFITHIQPIGLGDRRVVAPGRKVDLGLSAVYDRGTPDTPSPSPVGISEVIVNGEVVLDCGVMTTARLGRGLTRTPADS